MKLLKTVSFFAAFAVIALFSVSKTFAAVNSYILIENAKGNVTKVPIKKNGTFISPPLPAGKYTYSWSLPTTPRSTKRIKPSKSVAPNFTRITVTYDIVTPRNAATHTSSGRMHKPVIITKDLDRTSPTLTTQLGTVDLVADGDGITGKIEIKDQSGKVMSKADWLK